MANTKKPDLNALKEKSPMAVALATLLLLLFSFFVFKYFGANRSLSDKLNGEGAQDVVVEESTNEEANSNEANANDSTKENANGAVQGTEQQATAVWVANDIEPNTLQGKTYTVKRGDTLWEIAEGYTGNGADWVQIAQANNITYLPNGNPLIVPGQVLVIPMVQ